MSTGTASPFLNRGVNIHSSNARTALLVQTVYHIERSNNVNSGNIAVHVYNGFQANHTFDFRLASLRP